MNTTELIELLKMYDYQERDIVDCERLAERAEFGERASYAETLRKRAAIMIHNRPAMRAMLHAELDRTLDMVSK